MTDHSRDDETGHVFIGGKCGCGLSLKNSTVGVQLIPSCTANQNFDLCPPSLRDCPQRETDRNGVEFGSNCLTPGVCKQKNLCLGTCKLF